MLGVDLHPVYQKDYRPRSRDHFVIVKASEGSTKSYGSARDEMVKRSRDAGQIIGHYHWLHPGNISNQLDNFADHAHVRAGDLICCDWENVNPSVPARDMEAWVRAAEKRFPHNRVLVYTFPYYAPFRATQGKVYLGNGGLWIADYRSGGTPRDIFGLPWTMHQYTDDPFDHDRAQFDSVHALEAWADSLIPKPPTKDWFDMATKAELQAIVRAELERPEYIDTVARRVWGIDGIIESNEFIDNPEGNPWIVPETAVKLIRRAIGGDKL